MSKKIVLEFDEVDVKVAHIKHLQDTLTERNKKIKALEEKLNAGEGSSYARQQYEKGYKRGWIEASGTLMEQSRLAATYLTELHEASFRVYLEGDRFEVMGKRKGVL